MSLKRFYEDVPSDAVHYFDNYNKTNFLLRNTTAHYDPIITPLLVSAGVTGSFAIGTTVITYASVISAITVTALSIGVQMLFAPKPPKPEVGKVPLQQAVPYRTWGVGRNRSAGAYMLWESSGSQTALYAVQALRAHRIKSVNRYWLHDDEVTLKVGGVVNGLSRGRYAKDSVIIDHRLGLPTETVYDLPVTEFSASGLWTADHRGDGQASLFLYASAAKAKDQPKRFPYGVPALSVELDEAFCWDFRDPDQDPDDPLTWEWTQNSAVICAWHLCFNEFGFRLDYRKALLPVLDLWIEDADICDEDVPLAGGGTEKRYQCNGFDTTENGPKSGLNAILASCDGHLVARGDGARILTVGKFRESRCVTLTDADIIGHNVQYDVLFEDECNRLIPKFTYPATGYSTIDTDFFEDTDAQITSGRVLAEEANYQWVHQWRQARRLGKRDWLRLRQKVKGSIDVHYSGINAVYARWVRLTTPVRLPRLNGKLVENRRSVLALTRGGFSMDIVQHPENIDVLVPEVDEGAQPPVPTPADDEEIIVPVINLVQAKPNGQSVYIRVVIIDPEDDSLTPIVQYRLADNGTGSPGAWVPQEFPDAVSSGGFVELNTNVVPSDKLLDVQVAYKTSGDDFSEWSATASLMSTVGVSYDSDAKAVMDQMVVLGESPTTIRKTIINTTVLNLKAAGLWGKADRIWFEAAHATLSARLDWKNPTGTALVPTGTISFAIDRGFKGDGTTGYCTTGFNPGDGGVHLFTRDSSAVAVYALENIASAGADLGNTTNAINSRGVSDEIRVRSSTSTTDTVAGVGTMGFIATSRVGSADFSLYVNESAPVTVTRASIALANLEFRINGWNSTVPQYSPRRLGFGAAFSGLTSAEVSDLRDIVRTYLSAVGAI